MINRLLLLICFPAFSYATSFTDGSKDFGLSGGNDACWFDFNNDGWTDICVGGNVYRNVEGKKFEFVTKTGPCVAADFDNDGWVEVFFNNINGPNRMFTSRNGKEWEELKLVMSSWL